MFYFNPWLWTKDQWPKRGYYINQKSEIRMNNLSHHRMIVIGPNNFICPTKHEVIIINNDMCRSSLKMTKSVSSYMIKYTQLIMKALRDIYLYAGVHGFEINDYPTFFIYLFAITFKVHVTGVLNRIITFFNLIDMIYLVHHLHYLKVGELKMFGALSMLSHYHLYLGSRRKVSQAPYSLLVRNWNYN